jgi:hypothetical protein
VVNKNIFIILFSLITFSKLNAINMIQPFSETNDSLHNADTVLITTMYYDEIKIYSIDSICKRREQILIKMPVPVFVRPEKGKSIYLGNDSYRTEYDSINTLINLRHYKEKIGADTAGDVIREIYYYKGIDYFRVKYTNYKTDELLMIVVTEYMTLNYTINYFSNNKIIKIDNYTILTSPDNSSSHVSSYYEKDNLIVAKIINPNNCKIKFIQISNEYHHISFDQCQDLSFTTSIKNNIFSKKSIKKADKIWVKQK